MLTIDSFLSYKPKTSVVEIPEMGGSVTIREISVAATKDWADKTEFESTIEMIAASIVNEDGNLMFGNENRNVIGELPALIINKLTDAILELNGLKKTD